MFHPIQSRYVAEQETEDGNWYVWDTAKEPWFAISSWSDRETAEAKAKQLNRLVSEAKKLLKKNPKIV